MILKLKPLKHDEWGIRAELGRRGFTFRKLSEESGISTKSLSTALKRPLPRANAFIAKKLGMSVHELWPDWFDADIGLIPAKIRKTLSTRRREMASHESRVA